MKKYILCLIALLCSFYGHAIKYKSCTPEVNSKISSFDFELEFDLSDIIADLGESEDWGIYANGVEWDDVFQSDQAIKLYEGTPEEGKILGRTVEETINGKSAKFQTGNKFKFSFPGLTPEEGKLYTVEITLLFNVVKKGETKRQDTKYSLKCNVTPIDLTFIGSSEVVSEKLKLETSSISNGESLKSIEDIILEFNSPITKLDDCRVSIIENGEDVYSSDNVEVKDNSVTISFNNAILLKGHNYSLVVPDNSFSNLSGNSHNDKIVFDIKGDGHFPLNVISVSSENNSTVLLSNLEIKFELPNGAVFIEPSTATKYPAQLYQVSSDSESTLVSEILGELGDSDNCLKFPIDYELLPTTSYKLYIEDGVLVPRKYSATTNTYSRVNEYANSEFEFNFTTPSVENSHLDPIKFMGPALVVDRKELFNEDEPVENIEKLYFQLENNFYSYQGENLKLKFEKNKEFGDEGYDYGFLYKVTDSGDVKIKDVPLGYAQRFTTDGDSYWAIAATINSRFYEGTKYKFVIPAGILTVNSTPLQNFLHNEEISIEFLGKADANLQLTCSSLREGERVSHISAVAFHSDQELTLVNPSARMILRDVDGKELKRAAYSLYHEDTNNVMGGVPKYITRVMADFSDRNAFTPYYLPTSADEFQIVIAPGTFSLANDPEITNEEIVVNIKRVPETGLPEYVNLTSVVNEHAATVHPIEKGLKAKLQLTPSDDWEIEKVLFNGKDVTANVDEDGNYETPAVRIDSRMEVHLGYKGEVYFNFETGVVEVPDTDLRVMSEDDHIKIEGLAKGDNIKLYTMAGVLLAEDYATEDIAYINAPKDTIYIVVITDTNGKKSAVKILH